MKALDWLGRVVMLVLAGMVTLSIIGSIAAIPSGTPVPQIARTLPGLEDIGSPPPPEDRPLPSRREADPGTAGPPAPGTPTTVGAAPPPTPAEEAARWLEAITYALLALVGLAALACLLLWRGLHERRRLAAALEDLVRTRP